RWRPAGGPRRCSDRGWPRARRWATAPPWRGSPGGPPPCVGWGYLLPADVAASGRSALCRGSAPTSFAPESGAVGRLHTILDAQIASLPPDAARRRLDRSVRGRPVRPHRLVTEAPEALLDLIVFVHEISVSDHQRSRGADGVGRFTRCCAVARLVCVYRPRPSRSRHPIPHPPQSRTTSCTIDTDIVPNSLPPWIARQHTLCSAQVRAASVPPQTLVGPASPGFSPPNGKVGSGHGSDHQDR